MSTTIPCEVKVEQNAAGRACWRQECFATHVMLMLCVNLSKCADYVKYYLAVLEAREAMSADYTLLLCTGT